MAWLEHSEHRDVAKKVMISSQLRREENSIFDKLELCGLKSWTEKNKEKALNLLAKYHDIFALEHGEMGCTGAAEHKIEVTDPKPFKKG